MALTLSVLRPPIVVVNVTFMYLQDHTGLLSVLILNIQKCGSKAGKIRVFMMGSWVGRECSELQQAFAQQHSEFSK